MGCSSWEPLEHHDCSERLGGSSDLLLVDRVSGGSKCLVKWSAASDRGEVAPAAGVRSISATASTTLPYGAHLTSATPWNKCNTYNYMYHGLNDHTTNAPDRMMTPSTRETSHFGETPKSTAKLIFRHHLLRAHHRHSSRRCRRCSLAGSSESQGPCYRPGQTMPNRHRASGQITMEHPSQHLRVCAVRHL